MPFVDFVSMPLNSYVLDIDQRIAVLAYKLLAEMALHCSSCIVLIITAVQITDEFSIFV